MITKSLDLGLKSNSMFWPKKIFTHVRREKFYVASLTKIPLIDLTMTKVKFKKKKKMEKMKRALSMATPSCLAMVQWSLFGFDFRFGVGYVVMEIRFDFRFFAND